MSQQLHSFAELGKTQRNCSIRRRSQKLSNIANSLGEPARETFTEKGLAESENWSELIDIYRGNPLWLNIIVFAAIEDLFSGKISNFFFL